MEKFPRSIILKSPEKIQAQVEAFADSGVKEFSDEQKAILKNSAELAKITDLDNLPDDLSSGRYPKNGTPFLKLVNNTRVAC